MSKDNELNSLKEQEKEQNHSVPPGTKSNGEKEEGKAVADGKVIKIKEQEYQLLKEAAQYKEKYVRLYADFENTRKRFERDKSEFIKYANEGLIIEFLNIMDDLQRTVKAASAQHPDYEGFLKGIEMIMAHIYDLLKKNDVKVMDSLGKKFDPHCHEILMQQETSNLEDGLIIEEFQKGYFLGDRVIRTAKVKVAINKGDTKGN